MNLVFAASLYPESAIRAAADAYAETARVTIDREDNDFLVEIDDEVADHFANHVLHETIAQRHAR